MMKEEIVNLLMMVDHISYFSYLLIVRMKSFSNTIKRQSLNENMREVMRKKEYEIYQLRFGEMMMT